MSNKLTVVCWLFPGPRNYRPKYVSVLADLVRKHLSLKHRFVCVYDDRAYSPDEFEGVELVPMPEASRSLLSLGSLGGSMHPSCFSRLWHFSDEAAEVFPGRVFMFDVDSIPIGDMSHLVKYQPRAKFITMLRVPSKSKSHITGGSWILRSGSFPEVWDNFISDPVKARADATEWFLNGYEQKLVGWHGGSDQAYLSHQLVPQMKEKGPITYWANDCGILLWDHFRRQQGNVDGCLLHFNGPKKPWDIDWPLTTGIYGNRRYRVINKPLKYGRREYQVGSPFLANRNDAKALEAMQRIQVVA